MPLRTNEVTKDGARHGRWRTTYFAETALLAGRTSTRDRKEGCRSGSELLLLVTALRYSSSWRRMTLRSTTSTCLEEGCAPCKTGSLNTGEALLEVPDSRFVLAERVLETDSCLAAAAAHPAELGTPLSDEGLLACFFAGDGRRRGDATPHMHGARCAVHHVFIKSSLSRSNLSVYSGSYLMRDGEKVCVCVCVCVCAVCVALSNDSRRVMCQNREN